MTITDVIEMLQAFIDNHQNVDVLALESSESTTEVHISEYVANYNTKIKEYTLPSGVLIQ